MEHAISALTHCHLIFITTYDIESNQRNASLEDDVKNLSTKKERQDMEEKDVDESQQSAVDKNMIQVMNEKIRETPVACFKK